jgi:putative flippase GtrA
MRAARFAGVGFVGFAIQLLALNTLSRFGVHEGYAVAMAVEISILHNFAWHERWTWSDRRTGSAWGILYRLLRFNFASGIVSILGNVGLTIVCSRALHLPLMVANTLAVLTLSALNYAVADRLVFNGRSSGTLPGVIRHWLRNETIGSIRAARRAGT